jgi:hypothetical protein
LPGGTEENHTSLSQLVFRLRYEPRTFWIPSRSTTHTTVTSYVIYAVDNKLPDFLFIGFLTQHRLRVCVRTGCWGKYLDQSYPYNRPWRPIGLWEVEVPTFSKQSAHRWWWGCQPHTPAALCLREDSWYSFLLEAESTPGP